MHWFDRMSRQLAVAEQPGGSTRRGLLKGAALATVAAPLVGAGVARADGPTATASYNVSPDGVIAECENCFARVNNAGRELQQACSSRGAKRPARLARGKTGGGKAGGKKKMKPSEAARRTACQAKARKRVAEALKACGYFYCEAPETPAQPAPGGAGAEGKFVCPPGTAPCSQKMCCANGDLCCPCAITPEGFICCVTAVGCGCC
jgi:hypothetical protein